METQLSICWNLPWYPLDHTRGALAPRPETELTWTKSTDSSLQKKIKKSNVAVAMDDSAVSDPWMSCGSCRSETVGSRAWKKRQPVHKHQWGGEHKRRKMAADRQLKQFTFDHRLWNPHNNPHFTSEDCRLESRDFQDFSQFLETIINL